MDLNRVAIFVRVVEEGGFTAAARTLGLPKSSVSRAVSLLEKDLGARLLRRSTRRVTPTDAGAAFFERAARALADVEEAREAVADLEGEVRGPIRITAAVDAGVWLLAPALAEFAERNPAVVVDVDLTPRVVDLLHEGYDMALRVGPVRDESLVARRLAPCHLALYASRSYLEEHGRPRTVAELASHRCVLFRAQRGHTTWTLMGPHGEERVEVTGAIDTGDFSFVLSALAAGAGIGMLPSFVVPHARRELVERVLPDHYSPGATLHLVYPASRYVSRRVALLRDHLIARLSAPSDC